MSDNKDELEKEELKDVNSNETSKDNKEDDYEKICYVCRRPESKAGKMIDMPGGICVCTDCLQKSFNNFQNVGMNVNISEEELKNLLSELLRENKILVERTVPYANAGVIQLVRKSGELLEEEYREDGIYIRAYVPMEIYAKL